MSFSLIVKLVLRVNFVVKYLDSFGNAAQRIEFSPTAQDR